MTLDYAEPLLQARKALATYEAAILHGLAADAAQAAMVALANVEQLALYANRQA
jgi:hypothetical protein